MFALPQKLDGNALGNLILGRSCAAFLLPPASDLYSSCWVVLLRIVLWLHVFAFACDCSFAQGCDTAKARSRSEVVPLLVCGCILTAGCSEALVESATLNVWLQ